MSTRVSEWDSDQIGGKTHVNHQTAMKWTEIKLQNHCVNSSPKWLNNAVISSWYFYMNREIYMYLSSFFSSLAHICNPSFFLFFFLFCYFKSLSHSSIELIHVHCTWYFFASQHFMSIHSASSSLSSFPNQIRANCWNKYIIKHLYMYLYIYRYIHVYKLNCDHSGKTTKTYTEEMNCLRVLCECAILLSIFGSYIAFSHDFMCVCVCDGLFVFVCICCDKKPI